VWGEVTVVSVDQVVDVSEAPRAGELSPCAGELGVVAVFGPELVPLLAQACFMVLDPDLDRAQATHPREWPAERAERRVGPRAEVAQATPNRLTRHATLLVARLQAPSP